MQASSGPVSVRTCILLVGLVIMAALFLSRPSARRRVEHAAELQRTGKYAAALAAYRDLLTHIPATQPAAISLVQLHIGECLWQLEQPNDALRAFEKAVQEDGTNISARLRLAELYIAGDAPQRASEQAAYVIAQQPRNADALTLMGSAYASMDKPGVAVSFYKRAIEADPSRTEVELNLADLYARAGQPEKAREVLKQGIEWNPKDPSLRMTLGRLEEQEGNLPAAEESYRSAVAASDTPDTNLRLAQFLQRTARIPEAEMVLRRVDMRDPAAPTSLGDFEMVAGRPSNAAQRYSHELDAAGKSKASAAPAIAARLVEAELAGVSFSTAGGVQKGAVARAREHLDKYRRQLDPATARVLEAEIALADGNASAAQKQAADAVSLAPRSPAALYVLGVARYATGDKASARTQWEQAIDADSSFLPARLALARVAFEGGDQQAAQEQLAAVLRAEPANLGALLLYGRVLLAAKRFDAATVVARRAAILDASLAEPQALLGEIALARGRPGEALIDFEKSVLLDPQGQEAIDGLTQVYRSGRVTRPMLERMEAVAGHAPASATLFEVVGRLYADRGWYADAIRALQASLRLEPRRATAAAALARAYAAVGKESAAARSAQGTGDASAELLAGADAQRHTDTSAAIQHYEAALRAGEPSGVAANNLAWIYAQQGARLDRALQLARTARDTAPENPAFLDTLGIVHLRRREYSDAVDALKKAVLLASLRNPSSDGMAQFRQHLAEAYRLAGEPDEADKVSSRDTSPTR